jgi:hypothetical protein
MNNIFKIKDAHSDRIQLDWMPERNEYYLTAFGEHVGFISLKHAADIAAAITEHQDSLGNKKIGAAHKPFPKPKPADNSLVIFNDKVKAYIALHPETSFKDARAIVKAQK